MGGSQESVAFQLGIKKVSKNKQMTSGAEGREVALAGCLGSMSAIHSAVLGWEGTAENQSCSVCVCKRACVAVTAAGAPGEAPWGHVSTTWAIVPSEALLLRQEYQVPDTRGDHGPTAKCQCSPNAGISGGLLRTCLLVTGLGRLGSLPGAGPEG